MALPTPVLPSNTQAGPPQAPRPLPAPPAQPMPMRRPMPIDPRQAAMMKLFGGG